MFTKRKEGLMSFAENLKEAKVAANISQHELANGVGVD